MKTGTPNFFPVRNGTRMLSLYRQLLDMGMHVSDNVHTFSVSHEGHAGTYRLEADRLMNRDGFYVFKDGAPVLNGEERGYPSNHAEDLMIELINLKNVNRDLKEWEQATRLMTRVDNGFAEARLYDSGAIILSGEFGAHMADSLTGNAAPDDVEAVLNALLDLVTPNRKR